MPFYLIRRKIFAHFRILCLVLSVLGGGVFFSPALHAWLNSRLAIVDPNTQAFQETLPHQPFDKLMLEWDKLLRFGNISRHHRMAEIKTEIWWALINNMLTEQNVATNSTQQIPSPKGFNRSIKQWLDKNKRNLDMQLAYAQWQYASGKTKKAFARVRKFALEFPQHQALVAQYRAWSNKADAQLSAVQRMDPEIVRYLETAK